MRVKVFCSLLCIGTQTLRANEKHSREVVMAGGVEEDLEEEQNRASANPFELYKTLV